MACPSTQQPCPHWSLTFRFGGVPGPKMMWLWCFRERTTVFLAAEFLPIFPCQTRSLDLKIRLPESWDGQSMISLVAPCFILSGQIGGLSKGIPKKSPKNSGLGIILICPDSVVSIHFPCIPLFSFIAASLQIVPCPLSHLQRAAYQNLLNSLNLSFKEIRLTTLGCVKAWSKKWIKHGTNYKLIAS